MKDALLKYETIDSLQIDDLMNRVPVRAPSIVYDEAKSDQKPNSNDGSNDSQKPQSNDDAPKSEPEKAQDNSAQSNEDGKTPQ